MNRWPHQEFARTATFDALERGVRRLVVTSPTGGGKSQMMVDQIEAALAEGLGSVVYTNRKLLVSQLSKVLKAKGIEHGVRASGHQDQRDRPVQISSFQTEDVRVLKKARMELHNAARIIVDEAHACTGRVARTIMDRHHKDGAAIIGYTATPLDLGGVYDELIVAGTNSELRACGALVPALHYGPDEPDFRQHKVGAEDVVSEALARALMGDTKQLFGRVFDEFDRLNPTRRPTILFAPGVEESRWFAKWFTARGVRAAHIDGDYCWLDGREYPATDTARDEIKDLSERGEVKVICNRYVMREGVDLPWLSHCILATVFSSLGTYLQAVGRVLRAFEGLDHVTIQDHGGHWWRFGSVNADRQWFLGLTERAAVGARADNLRAKVEKEPVRCPGCGLILARRTCPGCGFEVGPRAARPVVMSDGTLTEHWGDIFIPRKVDTRPIALKTWTNCYFRMLKMKRNGGGTFRQAEALYAKENDWLYPPRTLPLMPLHDVDWYRRIKDVPRERLRGRVQEVVT